MIYKLKLYFLLYFAFDNNICAKFVFKDFVTEILLDVKVFLSVTSNAQFFYYCYFDVDIAGIVEEGMCYWSVDMCPEMEI